MKNILSSIRNYKRNSNDYTALHNMISNDVNILNIDEYMNGRIKELNSLLEAI